MKAKTKRIICPAEVVNTVNVIEITSKKDMVISQFFSFKNTMRGMQEAQSILKDLILLHYPATSTEEIACCLQERYFEQGDYYVAIIRNSNGEKE